MRAEPALPVGFVSLVNRVRGEENRLLVVYDVPSNRLRQRLAGACKDFGLERFQWSGFRGELSSARRRDLIARLRREIGEKTARVLVLPVCAGDLARAFELVTEAPDDTR